MRRRNTKLDPPQISRKRLGVSQPRAGPEKAVGCWSELCASSPLIFRPSGGVGAIMKLHRLEKAPSYQSVLLLLLLLLSVDLAPPGTA